MKTAMQELIDDIQQAFQGQWGVYLNSEKFAPYLEKEKEQLKLFYVKGHLLPIDDNPLYMAEKHFNKTFKSNNG